MFVAIVQDFAQFTLEDRPELGIFLDIDIDPACRLFVGEKWARPAYNNRGCCGSVRRRSIDLEAQLAYPNLNARILVRSRSSARRCALRTPLAVGDSLVADDKFLQGLQRAKA